MKASSQTLLSEARKFGVIVNIERGRNGERGEITLECPEGRRFSEELHGLVTEQQDDMINGGLEPWANVIAAALQDLRNNAPGMSDCPLDCPCREI